MNTHSSNCGHRFQETELEFPWYVSLSMINIKNNLDYYINAYQFFYKNLLHILK